MIEDELAQIAALAELRAEIDCLDDLLTRLRSERDEALLKLEAANDALTEIIKEHAELNDAAQVLLFFFEQSADMARLPYIGPAATRLAWAMNEIKTRKPPESRGGEDED